MKLLIVGIDGLGAENIETFGLHRLKSRLQAGVTGTPGTAYRISRGWCEIYSGQTAEQSGAYYQIATKLPNRRIVPSQKTGIDQVEKTMGAESMLWNRLENMGYISTVMTVPTVTAPRKVGGFSIGATGGGKFGNGLSPDDMFPADLLDDLHIDDLDLGLRMGYGGFLPKTLADLERKVDKHLRDYVAVLKEAHKRCPSDAMFLASRVLTEMAYKFTPLVRSTPSAPDERALRDMILSLCDRFDATLDQLIDDLAPENLFVVSDHGIRELKAEINLNESLVRLGLLKRNLPRQIARTGQHWYKRLKAKSPRTSVIRSAYKFETSKAFSISYIDAVYLNDDRFGGPAMDAATRAREARSLADSLNSFWSKHAPDLGLKFSPTGLSPYSGDADSAAAGGLPNPDVFCDTPEGVVNLKEDGGLITRPTYDFGPALYEKGFPGEFSGTKSNDTFAGYVGPHADAVTLDKLTDLYTSILSVAERAKQ